MLLKKASLYKDIHIIDCYQPDNELDLSHERRILQARHSCMAYPIRESLAVLKEVDSYLSIEFRVISQNSSLRSAG